MSFRGNLSWMQLVMLAKYVFTQFTFRKSKKDFKNNFATKAVVDNFSVAENLFQEA
jgi:hypothetical protein